MIMKKKKKEEGEEDADIDRCMTVNQ